MNYNWKNVYHFIYLILIGIITVYYQHTNKSNNATLYNASRNNEIIFSSSFSSAINISNKYKLIAIIKSDDCPLCIETLFAKFKKFSLNNNRKDSLIVFIINKSNYDSDFKNILKKKFRINFEIKLIKSINDIKNDLNDLKTPILIFNNKQLFKVIQVLPYNIENVNKFFDNII